MSILSLLVVLLILGAVSFLVSKAPILNPDFKTFINYVLIVVGVVVVLVFLVNLLGGNTSGLNLRLN